MLEPQPAGERGVPPRSGTTCNGTAPLPGARVLVDLHSPIESERVSAALQALGYAIEQGSIAETLNSDFELAYTDDIAVLATFAPMLHPDPDRAGKIRVVALIEDEPQTHQEAWEAGADWVVTRPFNPEDPFGDSAFSRG